ncbi:MAG: hypothetical protein WCO51_07540 [bacterium]
MQEVAHQSPSNRTVSSRLSIPWIGKVALLFMTATLLPYLIGWSIAGKSYYTGFHYNADDFCVYTAWMTQAKQGHFFFDNRFTTDPQPRQTVHLFFWALGTIERFTNLPPQIILHLARFIFGILMIWAFYRLSQRLLTNEESRRWAVLLALLSSGLGWTAWQTYGWIAPADAWQPELMTFTSLYFNPLFAVAGWLILEVWLAVLDAEKSWKAVPRGALFALLLANIHTYDIVTIAAVGVGFVILKAVMRQLDWRWLLRVGVIALGAIPPLLWLLHVHSVDAVFRSRAATQTFSEPLWKYLMGFGLLIPLALAGMYYALRKRDAFTDNARALLPAWAVIGFAIPYLPVLFQRKLWMGEQWPLVLLAAGFLWLLLSRLPSPRRLALFGLVLLVLIPTNIKWVQRDFDLLLANKSNTTMHWPYLDPDLWDVIQWFGKNTQPDEGVVAMPNLACYISAFAGNRTYVSHWSETPDFITRLNEVRTGILSTATTIDEKRYLLNQADATYVLTFREPAKIPELHLADLSPLGPIVYENGIFRVYRVR